jgi:putative SOS response-associated peptidase YedK
MCSRYVLSAAEKEILEAYAAEIKTGTLYQPNNNIAVTDQSLVITADEPELLQYMELGLIPENVEPDEFDLDTFNARDDRLLKSKLWRPLLEKHQVCIIVANGFYEWKDVIYINKLVKQPYLFTLTDRPLFSFPGLWSRSIDPKTNQPRYTFAIITTKSNNIVGEIHEKKRMPVILPRGKEGVWLDKNTTIEELVKLCLPYPDPLMLRKEVSRTINRVKRKKPTSQLSMFPENSE